MVNGDKGQKKAGNLRFQRKIISHEKNYIYIFTLKWRKILQFICKLGYQVITMQTYIFFLILPRLSVLFFEKTEFAQPQINRTLIKYLAIYEK